MVGFKVFPFLISFLLDMIGFGDILKGVLCGCLVKGLHIVVEGLLVAQVPMKFQVVVTLDFGCLKLAMFQGEEDIS